MKNDKVLTHEDIKKALLVIEPVEIQGVNLDISLLKKPEVFEGIPIITMEDKE